MRVLITGGSGRIAKALTPRLIELNHSIVLSSRSEITAPQGAALVSCNALESPASLRKHISECDAVIHLACSSNPAVSQADPWGDLQRNLAGTLALFAECAAQGVKKFIYASSGGTIYGSPQLSVIPEDTPLRPISMHGAMKASAEAYLSAAAQGTGTVLQIMRISNPYGLISAGQQQGFIDVAFARLKRGENLTVFGDGSVTRDYIFHADMTAAFAAALSCDQPFVLNIGAGVGTSLAEIIEYLGRHFDLHARIEYKPKRDIDVPRNVLDISAAKALLHWQPVMSISEGIRHIAESK
jgi:UDP-glucose 4-epimerase